MPDARTVAIVGKHSADREPDGYFTGWFSGDLADELPTEILPAVREESPRHGWAEPTTDLLARLLDGLRKRL